MIPALFCDSLTPYFDEIYYMKRLMRSLPLFWALVLTSSIFAADWHTVKYPTAGASEIYGSYANGCFAGGIDIATQATGYEQVRPSRNRHYGMPTMAQFVNHLNLWADQRGKVLILGDISQPRGGPANFGHASHQTGLDIDIWFEEREDHLPHSLRESLQTPSVVNPTTGKINQHWHPFYREILFMASQYPETERIFVNPIIKAHLCATEKDQRWLNKLRPWYGHDSHFHIRLKCPTDAAGCIAQAPIPQGSGCDASLTQWVKDQIQWTTTPPKPKVTSTPKAPKVLPIECKAILTQP